MPPLETVTNTAHPVLHVRVIPRSGRSGVAGIRDGAWLIRLNAAPVEDAANAELISVLADALHLPRRAVTIVAGARARQKRVRVSGIDAPTAEARLHAALTCQPS